MRTLNQHLYERGKKRILSLDGGGVRGLVTLGFLSELESQLGGRFAGAYIAAGKQPSDFRLCDYFDLIGGTSTGGIIAAMLALGFAVDDVRKVYLKMCPRVFERGRKGFLSRFFNPYSLFRPSFDAQEFKRAVDEIMDLVLERGQRMGRGELLLGTDMLRTGAALVTKRIDTGSVWALTNNERMKYWDPDTPHWPHSFPRQEQRFFPNAKYPLGILARATASAPFLLEAAELAISPLETGVFLDGGATPFNNPALELFLMTTLKEYDEAGNPTGFSPFGFDWDADEQSLLLYSIGTGHWRVRMSAEDYRVKQNWEKAKIALVSMIDDGMKSSLTWLQALSEPMQPVTIDGNLGDMRNFRITPRRLLTFQRMNLDMETEVLGTLLDEPVTQQIRDQMRELDNSGRENLERLDRAGQAAGKRLVKAEHLPPSFDPF